MCIRMPCPSRIAVVLALAFLGSSQGQEGDKGTSEARLVIQAKQAPAVTSVAFSADGKRILTGGGDGAARLRDTQTGEQIPVRKAHAAGVSAVAFSHDRK